MAKPVEIEDIFPAPDGPAPAPAAVLAIATAADSDDAPRAFTPLERFAVWSKAREARPLNCAYWRLDESGNLMAWGDYGDAQSPHGWLIDHIVPLSMGGTNAPDNLEAIHVGRRPSASGFIDTIYGAGC